MQYTDLYGREVRTDFSIVYNKDIVYSTTGDIPVILGSGYTEKIAVYASNPDKLVYFGEKKNEWKNVAAVWNTFKDASYMRVCWIASGNAIVCMMPVQTRIDADKKSSY